MRTSRKYQRNTSFNLDVETNVPDGDDDDDDDDSVTSCVAGCYRSQNHELLPDPANKYLAGRRHPYA
jgi:hypothetical protein